MLSLEAGVRFGRSFALGLGLVLTIGLASPLKAEIPTSLMNAIGLSAFSDGANEIQKMQADLAWIGILSGPPSGRLDLKTRRALQTFQAGVGAATTGRVTSEQRKVLRKRAADVRHQASFRAWSFEWNGMQIGLPLEFYPPPLVDGEDGANLVFFGHDAASSKLEMHRYFISVAKSALLRELRDRAEDDGGEILVDGFVDGFVYVIAVKRPIQDGYNAARRVFYIYSTNRREARGIEISFDDESTFAMLPFVYEMLRKFDPWKARGVPQSQLASRVRAGDTPRMRNAPDWFRDMQGSGSGSIVSRDGHVLTNYHVVSGCGSLTVNGAPARLLASDVRIDLALVQSSKLVGREPVRFASDPISIGEDLYVLGYPAPAYPPSFSITFGIASSRAGYSGDRKRIQMTAPVQPGNSGGPVVSAAGVQVGVVVEKYIDTKNPGYIENVSWAIRGAEAQEFLRRFEVRISRDDDAYTPPQESMAELVKKWRRFTVRVECQER